MKSLFFPFSKLGRIHLFHLLGRIFAVLLVVLGLLPAASGNEPANNAKPASDQKSLNGTWLAQSAMREDHGLLGWVWTSRFVVNGNSFDISHVYDASKDLHLRGTFSFHPEASSQAIDLDVDEFDMSATGQPVKYPHCILHGIYKLEGSHLAICVPVSQEAERPTDFQPRKNEIVLDLVRASADFEFPHDITLTVKDPQDNPAAGLGVSRFMSYWVGGTPNPKEPTPTWKFQEIAKTGADGTARVAYQDLDSATVRDPARKLIGLTLLSPASVLEKAIMVQLQPESTLRGAIVCNALSQAGKPVGWTNVLLFQDGRQLAQYSSRKGEFEFPVAPGHYTLFAYGSDVLKQYVHAEVPAGSRVVQMPPILAEALNLALIEGKPAPELREIVGWKGTPIKLAEQREKLVLLDFWGYWCGPCVAQMPTLIELHERYHDRGLVIVGMHVDEDGEVDTATKLDEKIAPLKRERWHGKNLPFPIALMSGKQHSAGRLQGTLADYGIDAYPTTILIDKNGNVVGTFEVQNRDEAIAEIEKLLDPTGKN